LGHGQQDTQQEQRHGARTLAAFGAPVAAAWFAPAAKVLYGQPAMAKHLLPLWMLLLTSLGCRPELLRGLDNPNTPAAAWQELRQAHTGGRTVKTMRFLSQETFHPGVAELTYPELSTLWMANSRYDFSAHTAWQVASAAGHRLTWVLQPDGTLTITRDGQPTRVLPGVDRGVHLRVMFRLLQPWDPFGAADEDVTLMPPRNGHVRLRFQQRSAPQDTVYVEVDRHTGLASAVEFTVNELHLPFLHRDEYRDYRNVGGGIMVAHTIRENVSNADGPLNFHDMMFWNVEVELENPFPGGELPRYPGPPGVAGSATPVPGSARPSGTGR
jgi:hypothetical protein